jgi:REP element-mobilizing transposase RayT
MHGRQLQFAAGCYYHLYNRGANRNTIFLCDNDYCDFLNRLRNYAVLHATSLIAYCLMPNHFHLLVRQDGEDRSGVMVQLACNGYTQAFNRRHQHSGTLFQGRYQRILVDNSEYLRHLCRYIHANPVKDGFAFQPELWPYSNYADWISGRPGAAVDSGFIVEFFGSADNYCVFVRGWAERRHMPDPLRQYLTALEQAE